MIPNTGYEKNTSMQMTPPPLKKRTEKQVNLNSKKISPNETYLLLCCTRTFGEWCRMHTLSLPEE